MPKKCGIETLYYHDFAEKIRANSLKKCELVRKMLGKSVCVAYLCSMFDRIKAYIRLQKIISARIREWENFMEWVRMASLQSKKEKRELSHAPEKRTKD